MKLSKFKMKNPKKIAIITLAFIIGIITGYVIFYNSYAFYEEKKNFDVINGTVEDPGDIYFAYYIDNVISREMPMQNTGYTLDTEKSNCNNGVIPNWDNAGWKFIGDYHNYSATTNTRTKCNLYFNKTAKIVSTTLGNIEVNTYTPDFTKSACDDTSCESHEKGIFETTDTDGSPTYYYRGSVENNYVKFAGFYWRIIRINSNGSIRMIYDGTSAHDNEEVTSDKVRDSTKFNSSGSNNMYIGYMYTQGEVHGLGTSSIIKETNDKFYETYFINYAKYFDGNVGFCNDRRTIATSTNNNAGIERNDTYYQGYKRVVYSQPDLTCDSKDLFTQQNSSIGNKALIYAIGLITLDEMLMAGYGGGMFEGTIDLHVKGQSGYLYSEKNFWTMTPAYGTLTIGDGYWSVGMFLGINNNGTYLDDYSPAFLRAYLRPVINIKSNVTITGSGTKTEPYVVN